MPSVSPNLGNMFWLEIRESVEEDSNKRVIHTIGGQTWQQWLLYKGNEDKLGKK